MLRVRVGPAFLGEKVEEQDKLTENGRSRSVSESVNRITFRSEPYDRGPIVFDEHPPDGRILILCINDG